MAPPKKAPAADRDRGAPVTLDPRFSVIHSDPRFAPPKRKDTKVKLDSRFSKVLTDARFSAGPSAPVDKYGRKIGGGKREDRQKEKLKRFYDLDEGEDEEEGEEKAKRKEIEGEEKSEEDEESSSGEEPEIGGRYDPARGEGVVDTSDESSEESDDELDSDVEIEDQALEPEIPEGEVTTRFAVVNLDWDHVNAVDLMKTFSSFAPQGKVVKVSVFPSEFGKERMEREEMEGPPSNIFKKREGLEESEESEDDDLDEDERIRKSIIKEDKGEEFDSQKLRTYQLERLRYYYAVVECDSLETAKTIYDACDGAEYEATANFFDLRFIPEGTTFDDEPRDISTTVPADYRPKEFVTDALQHSKVKLTWDADDENRKEVSKRAFSMKDEMDNELKAYLASSESEDSEDEDDKAAKAAKYRSLLGGLNIGKGKDKDAPSGDMEVTFTSGLPGDADDEKVIDSDDGLTTIEKYAKKEKERKMRRKEKAKLARETATDAAATGEEIIDDELPTDDKKKQKKQKAKKEPVAAAPAPVDPAAADLGFADPFFEEPVQTVHTQRRAEKQKRKEEKAAAAAISDAKKAELELLMADEEVLGVDGKKLAHFDMKSIMKAEKADKLKKKAAAKKRKGVDTEVLQDNFKIDTKDERFKAVFDSHQYAIDPTNPRFLKTQNMQKMIEERRKRGEKKGREVGGEDEEEGGRDRKKRKKADGSAGGQSDDVKKLVESLKRKAKK